MMSLLRTALKIAGVLLVGLVIAIVGVWGALQTRSAKDWLAAQLGAALSSPTQKIEIARIRGLLPFGTRVAELHVSDDAGEWLVARDLAVEIAGRDLLHGKLTLKRVAAADIRVLRPPRSNEAATPAAVDSPPSLPHIPSLPLALELSRFEIDLIVLQAPVLGEEAIVTVAGAAALEHGAARAELAVRRIDGQPGAMTLRLMLAEERLALDATVSEPSGLLLGALLQRDDKPTLMAELTGDGPLADWHGKLTASAGELARLDAELALAVAETMRGEVTGTLAASSLLPPEFAPLIGDKLTFALAGAALPDGRMILDRLRVDAAAATLAASGALAPDRSITAQLHGAAPELATLAAAFGVEASGAATLSATVAGTLDRPTLDATLEGRALRYADETVESAVVHLEATPTAPLADPSLRFDIAADGTMQSVRLAEAPLPAGLGEAIDWRLTGNADAALENAELGAFTLASGGIEASASGTARGKLAELDASVRLVVGDLARFATLAGTPGLAGSARVEIRLRRSGDDAPITAELTGSADEFTTGTASLDALLGRHADLAAKLRRDPDGAMSAEDVVIATPALRLTATAGLGGDDDRITADAKLDLPRLAPLGPALGTRLGGSVSVTAKLDGPLAAPAGEIVLSATNIVSGAQHLDRLDATLAIRTLREPAGALDARFRAADLAGQLAGEFELRDSGRALAVSKLRLGAAGTSLDGNLLLDLATSRVTGTLAGRIPDLKPWSGLAGMRLAGRAEMKATLGAKSGQTLDATATISNLVVATTQDAPTTIERVSINARLVDLLGAPSGRAELQIGKIGFAGGEIAATRLSADSGKPGRFTVNLETRGTVREKMTLALTAEASLGATALELRVTRFAGAFAGQDFRLRQPLLIQRHGTDLAFSQLALTLGEGDIQGSGSRKGDALGLKLAARDLPLGMAARLAGQDEVSGRLALEIELAGTLVEPRGHLLVQGRELHLAAASRADFPPLSLVAEATWRGGRADFKGRVAAPNNEAIGFSGAAPLKLNRAPLGIELPRDGAVALKVEGDGKLEDLADLLPLGEDRVAGNFHLDATVGGTVAAPTAGGRFTLERGRYESQAAGTVLANISLELVGDRDRFVLRRFAAGDGDKGTLSAEGAVVLSASPGPALDLGATLRRFRVAKRDEVTATASGEIRVGGTLGAPAVTSRIRIEDAEIRVPDRLPATIVKLDPIEINSRTGEGDAAKAPAKPKAPALVATLDIVVDAPNQIFVRGRGLDSEWKSHVTAKGTSAAPDVAGTLEVVRGTFSFLGKKFTLSSGTITFDGGGAIDPRIDITTEARSADITAQVLIGGRASAPTVKLTSQPELPQDEVLARVLFGRGVGQLTPGQGIQLAQAASTLAGGGPGVLDKLRSKVGLDRLDIGSAEESGGKKGTQSNSGTSGTTVSAGKYVAEGVYVGVDQTVSGQSKAKVEVELFPHVTVETDAGGGSAGQGIGLNWKMDY